MNAQANVSTLYLDPRHVVEIISAQGLPQCLIRLVDYIRDDFLRWEEFDKTARLASHSVDGVIELMPISDANSYAFKYVNGHPKNTRLGLSTVMAFGVLADVDTGLPRLLSELTLTTALRTAATSALAARSVARPGSRIMALIGNGAQSEFQALAFQHVVGVEEVRLYDIDQAATCKLVANLSGSGLQVIVCGSTAEAVHGADIVTTVTADKSHATILTPDLIQPGMHINGVGGDCPGKTELHAGILQRASVFVEYAPQTRIEGDIQQMPPDFPVTELWAVLRGVSSGRRSDEDITVFDSVGFALEDYAALRFMYDTARSMGVGDGLSLIPSLTDPKDLYATLLRPDD